MYSIHGLTTVFDVMAYTVKAMKEVGYIDGDIEDYIRNAIKDKCNYSLLEISKSQLEECNRLNCNNSSDINDKWFDDTWQDYYYSSLWDDDGERYKHNSDYSDDDEDTYNYLTSTHRHNIWDEDNVIDDIESSDEEAYEGFSSCKNHTWDCTADDDYFDDGRIVDYYDNMKREDGLEPSYDPFNDPDNDEAMEDF